MVHTFERAGLKIALDVGSGAVHVLDDIAFALLSQLPGAAFAADGAISPQQMALFAQFDTAQVRETYDELKKLAAQGLLYSDDSYREFAGSLGIAPVKAMCLHIAHDCNLRCRYCFASTGDFGGGRKLMSLDVAKKAIDLLVRLSEGRRNLEVDFFGGEPLMNFDVVKQTVDYARGLEKQAGKNFRFTVTTNGLALNDDISSYINREMSNVVLSLDGRKHVNDAMRPMVSGKGSYDTIVPKYQALVRGRGGKEYYVRGTYTRDNLDFDRDVLEMYNLGFDQISVEPVVGPETDDYSIRDSDVAEIEASYTRLMEDMIQRRKAKNADFNFFHFMLDLDNGPCAIKRLKGCGSGNEYLAVTPEGDLYPCHQFVGNEEFIMGTVYSGITQPQIRETFAKANLLNKPDCQGCWAKFYCSGGCNANNHSFNGSILQPHQLSCKLEKIRLECAIAIQAALSVE